MADNFERGDRALRVMEAYGAAGGFNEQEGMLGTSTLFHEGYPFGDLIADLCHLMRRHDIDVADMLTRGLTHYAADVIEQAWEHSDGWHDVLQDESNLMRAEVVMETAGVPEAVRENALRYVGLLPSL